MSKNNQKSVVATKDESLEVKTTEEVSVANTSKEPKLKDKKDKKQKDKKASKTAKNVEPKRSRVKETFAELKKVTWPTFGKTMKQTGMVLSVVLIFGIVVFGFDLLISYIIQLLSSI